MPSFPIQLPLVYVAAALLTSTSYLGQALWRLYELSKFLHPSCELRGITTWLWNRWEEQRQEPVTQLRSETPPLLPQRGIRQLLALEYSTKSLLLYFLLTACFWWHPRVDHFDENDLLFFFLPENKQKRIKKKTTKTYHCFSRQSVNLIAAVSSWLLALLCLLPEMRLWAQLSLDYGKAFSSLFCLI